MDVIKKYLDLISYQDILSIMEEKLSEVVQQKKIHILGAEHPKIYTAGLRTQKDHILNDIVLIQTRRGGSVTVHNPGQLMFYPVFPLEVIHGNLGQYIRLLETTMIETLRFYRVEAFQNPDHTGVWTGLGKIGFIGIGAKKGAVYHGAAVNIMNDLEDYRPILSCGLKLPVTRLLDQPQYRALDHSSQNVSLQTFFFQWAGIFEKNLLKTASLPLLSPMNK